MKSFELLRAAATLILEGGWASGQDVTGQPVDACDAEGFAMPLYVTGSTETGRAAPNPAAVGFSAYGAIVTALHRNGGRLEDPAAMWTLLAKRASEINNVAHGGDNLVHPLHQFNVTKGQTVEQVLLFLGACATEMEGVHLAIKTLVPEPFEVRAIPRLAEPKPYPGVALGPSPAFPETSGLGPHSPATLREVFDAVLDPNAKPLPPALTVEDVKDLHTTLAVPFQQPTLPAGVEITGITPPVLLPYKPMLTPGRLREEHPPALYSGPELNMKGMPNPFGGDDEQH